MEEGQEVAVIGVGWAVVVTGEDQEAAGLGVCREEAVMEETQEVAVTGVG